MAASDLRISSYVAVQSISAPVSVAGKRVRNSPTFASGGCSETMRPTDHALSDQLVDVSVALAAVFVASAIVPDAAVGYAAVGAW